MTVKLTFFGDFFQTAAFFFWAALDYGRRSKGSHGWYRHGVLPVRSAHTPDIRRTGDIPPGSDCTGAPCRYCLRRELLEEILLPMRNKRQLFVQLRATVIFPVFIFGFIVKPFQVEQLGD